MHRVFNMKVTGTIAISLVALYGVVEFESTKVNVVPETPVAEQTLATDEDPSKTKTSNTLNSSTFSKSSTNDKPDFSAFTDVKQKKSAFFEYLHESVVLENQRVLQEREKLALIRTQLEAGKVATELNSFAKRLGHLYHLPLPNNGVDDTWLTNMLSRVNVLPAPLVLSQGANESAWGTSRFAVQANNYFGQWCYQKGCGLVPLHRNSNASHEVAKFDSIQESVYRYFMNVNRNTAYKELRRLRHTLADNGENIQSSTAAIMLANGLLEYSERGQDYVVDIQNMIRQNKPYWEKLTQ